MLNLFYHRVIIHMYINNFSLEEVKIMSNKNITKWSKMTLRNNYMFRLVMEKNNLCKPLIERVLGIKIKSLSYV